MLRNGAPITPELVVVFFGTEHHRPKDVERADRAPKATRLPRASESDGMNETLEFVLRAVLIGAGATAVTDVWAVCRARLFGGAAFSYGLVGRWLGHLARGRFAHDSIANAPAIRGERSIGWVAHYAIGIVFAMLLLAIWGLSWAQSPTLLPALIVGLVTLAAPFFLMQPGMGAGIAASKTPNPNAARFRSLVTHLVFGIGLYASAAISTVLI